ncbi:MAG: recombinase family protein, partial [Candidatus Omnitrophica bacterium]|nr:recombinase family protein [Candidatus Omnitrophota bacterium]
GHLLRNPFYYGMMRVKGELYEGCHPPLVSKKLFDRVQEVLEKKAKPVKKGEIKFMFRGFMKCGECGASVTAEIQKGHIYYRCTKKIVKCSQKFLREDALLSQINKAILKIFIDDETKDKMINRLSELCDGESKASSSLSRQASERLRELDERIERLIDLYVAKEITQEEYQKKKAKLLNNKKELQERLGEIEKTNGGWLEPARAFVTTCNEAGSVAWQGNPSAKRDFLKIFSSNFILKDRSFLFKRAYPYELVAKIDPTVDWLPVPQIQRIFASAKLRFPVYMRYTRQGLAILEGDIPHNIKTDKRITRKLLKQAKPIIRRPSPLLEALRYAEVLNEPSVVSKTQVGKRFGITRARVCQMLNLLELDDRIKSYLSAIKNPKEHNFFTERKLRNIAVINDKHEQLRKFGELLQDMRTD